MTSQSVVSNADGVALASDSAVTLGGRRTFDSANKIYPLGGNHKVAVMISDSARYAPGGVSWSKFFHQFASSLSSPCETMQEYADKMIRWANDGNMFDERQNDIAIQNCLTDWFDWQFAEQKMSLEIGEMATRIFMEPAEDAVSDVISEADIENDEEYGEYEDWAETYTNTIGDLRRLGRSSLVAAIGQLHSNFESQRKNWGLGYVEGGKEIPPDHGWIIREKAVFEKTRANCEEVADRIAEHLGLEDRDKENLTVVFQNFLTRFPYVWKWKNFPPNDTGSRLRGYGVAKVILSGYGTADETPVIVECMCGPWIDPDHDMFVQDCILKIRPQQHVFDNGWANGDFSKDGIHEIDASAIVRGYAFKSEMDNILTGIHPFVMSDLMSRRSSEYGTGEVANDITKEIIGVVFASLEEIKGIGDKRVTEIMSEIDSRLRGESTVEKTLDEAIQGRLQTRRHRFRGVLQSLPVPDLADFARELVNIEKRICYWLEPVRSVGGEVSVITITKEEGVKIIE